jgi:hypothetical protein
MGPNPDGNSSDYLLGHNRIDLAWASIDDGHQIRGHRERKRQLLRQRDRPGRPSARRDLKKIGFFDSTKGKEVLLHTDQTGTIISFVVGQGWEDEEIQNAFKQVGDTLAQDLEVNHLKIRLIDDHLNTKKELPIN